MSYLRKVSILCASVFLLSSSQAVMAKSDAFGDGQKKQIEKIIHDYLLNNPQILVEVSQKLQEQQQKDMQAMEKKAEKTIPKLARKLFNDKDSPSMGDANAPVTIVEFFDYQCSHCKDMSEVLDGLSKKNKDIRVVYKEFPIFGNASMEAARAALAANMQGKYAAMHDALMNTSNPLTDKKVMEAAKTAGLDIKKLKIDMQGEVVKEELEENLMLSQKLGLMGTPAFVVGHTQKGSKTDVPVFFVPGATSEEMLQSYIEKMRAVK